MLLGNSEHAVIMIIILMGTIINKNNNNNYNGKKNLFQGLKYIYNGIYNSIFLYMSITIKF